MSGVQDAGACHATAVYSGNCLELVAAFMLLGLSSSLQREEAGYVYERIFIW